MDPQFRRKMQYWAWVWCIVFVLGVMAAGLGAMLLLAVVGGICLLTFK